MGKSPSFLCSDPILILGNAREVLMVDSTTPRLADEALQRSPTATKWSNDLREPWLAHRYRALMINDPKEHFAHRYLALLTNDPNEQWCAGFFDRPLCQDCSETRKGKAALVTPELMREELVESAVSFLKHPKVLASTDAQRRSFLEKKGLTVDEIDEAFRRLLSPSSNTTSSIICRFQGISDHSCRITQENEIDTKCMDDSGKHEPETAPVVPQHPKSYMEIMEMIRRGERPDDIQDVNDVPPNPYQPISESRLAPKPKPWEKQGDESPSLKLKSQSSNSSESRSEVQLDSTIQATGLINNSNKGDLQFLAETVEGTEAPTDDAAP